MLYHCPLNYTLPQKKKLFFAQMFKELSQQAVSVSVNKNRLFLRTLKMIMMDFINVQCILYLMGEKVFCKIIKIYYINSDICLIFVLKGSSSTLVKLVCNFHVNCNCDVGFSTKNSTQLKVTKSIPYGALCTV